LTVYVAGQRIHGTTRERPLAVFELERVALKALSTRRPDLVVWHQAQLHRDSQAVFRGGMYSAPWRFIGKKVWVRADHGSVQIFSDDVRVSSHKRQKPGKRRTDDRHLPEHRSDYRHRARCYWETRADALGAEVARTFARSSTAMTLSNSCVPCKPSCRTDGLSSGACAGCLPPRKLLRLVRTARSKPFCARAWT
jgi:hypothetical protein